MTTKKRNNLNHPWKKSFSVQNSKMQKENKKELDKINAKAKNEHIN